MNYFRDELLFEYDDCHCLTEIIVNGKSTYRFVWKTDALTGQREIHTINKNGIEYLFSDAVVILDPLYGESRSIPYSVYVTNDNIEHSYELISTKEIKSTLYEIVDWNEGGTVVAKIEYDSNRPSIIFTENATEEDRVALDSYCRFLDGAIYIEEIEAYYYPDRAFVNAVTENTIECNISYLNQEIIDEVELEYEDSKIKYGYGDYEYSDMYNWLMEKSVDGRITSEYYWKNQEGIWLVVDRIVTNGVQVDYLYSQNASKSSYRVRHELFGFTYNDKLYIYSIDNKNNEDVNDDVISIFCDGEEVAVYDVRGNLLRGKGFPKEVDVLIRLNDKKQYMGHIYTEEPEAEMKKIN